MKKVLARLGFALLVLAFVLAWEGYRAATGRSAGGGGRAAVFYAGAAALFLLGITGIRERHRRP